MKGRLVEILLEEFMFYQCQKDSKIMRKIPVHGVVVECLDGDYYVIKLFMKEEPEYKFNKNEFRVLL